MKASPSRTTNLDLRELLYIRVDFLGFRIRPAPDVARMVALLCQPLLAPSTSHHRKLRKSLVGLVCIVGHVESPVFHLVACRLVIGHAVTTLPVINVEQLITSTTDAGISNERGHEQ